MRKKIISLVMYMKKAILICFMKNVMSILIIMLVIFLKKISTYLYMMNVRMATWMMHLKKKQTAVMDWITKKKERPPNGILLYVF